MWSSSLGIGLLEMGSFEAPYLSKQRLHATKIQFPIIQMLDEMQKELIDLYDIAVSRWNLNWQSSPQVLA